MEGWSGDCLEGGFFVGLRPGRSLSGNRRLLLPEQGGLCGKDSEVGSGSTFNTAGGEANGYHQRGPSQGAWIRPSGPLQSTHMSGCVWAAGDRQSIPSWAEGQESHPWRRGVGGLDVEFGGSACGPTRGRVGGIEEKGARAGREGKARDSKRESRGSNLGRIRDPVGEEEEEEEEEGKEERQEVQEPKEGPWEEQGGLRGQRKERFERSDQRLEEAGRKAPRSGESERPARLVRRDRSGCGRSSQEASLEDGPPILEQERLEEKFVEFVINKFPEQPNGGRGGGRGEPLHGDRESQVSGPEVPRSLGLWGPAADEKAAPDGSGRRPGRYQQQAHRSSLLQAGVGEASKWTYSKGAAHIDHGSGCSHSGAPSGCSRYNLPEDQILRDQSPRDTLGNFPEDGNCGTGHRGHCSTPGTALCPQRVLRGQSHQILGLPRPEQARPKRKRKREGQQREQGIRQGRERRLPRKERRGERREVKVKKSEVRRRDEASHVTGRKSMKDDASRQLGELPECGGRPPEIGVQQEVAQLYDSNFSDHNPFEVHGQAFRPALTEDVQAEVSPSAVSAGFSRLSEKSDALFVEFDGVSFNVLGSRALQYLLEVFPLRSKSTGGCVKGDLFPLPTSRRVLEGYCPNLDSDGVSWLISVCLGLNSFWGSQLFNDQDASGVQHSCLKLMSEDVVRFCLLTEKLEAFEWETFFKNRGIDYHGEEVKVARYFTWENVAPALPAEVGRVPLQDLCTFGAKHYVENFEMYLKPRELWAPVSKPRVMVEDSDWGAVCKGLVQAGVCTYLTKEELFVGPNGPLLNGMFGVSKDETKDGVEVFRLIMNLIPLNTLCQGISGDIQTLPSWSLMNPFFLQPHEQLLVSSEDVRCFFYVMSVPPSWWPFLGFNKRVPREVLPDELVGEEVYLASRVLPMGFLNSVSLAQHVHRNLVLSSTGSDDALNLPQEELRKDRPTSSSNPTWRVYLDNYDLLEKVEGTGAVSLLQGTMAPQVLALREQYELWDIPRNAKKAAERQLVAEVQGACVDGARGLAFPKEQKLAKYISATLALVRQPLVSQRQMQVVCGGLVYVSMFRRALLGTLNAVWKFISSFPAGGGLLALPPECKVELTRFIALAPLARMDFRLPVHPMVTCSDASSHGGGICASAGLTITGVLASQGLVRGEYPEVRYEHRILSIGLFDGIGALRVALDLVDANVLGHVSVECSGSASRVVESHFPGTIFVEDIELVDEKMVREWACRYSQASVILVGGGPPCQGVSGLNSDRKGALKDARSCLFIHVKRIKVMVQQAFPWCQVHSLMESVASMDECDMVTMSEDFGSLPYKADAGSFMWCNRPRYYWITWPLWDQEGVDVVAPSETTPGVVKLSGAQHLDLVTKEGWMKVDPTKPYPTFTTSRPRNHPGRKPAGISQCSPDDISRWSEDQHRFPPYQYKVNNCLINRSGALRLPTAEEREVIMGFPLNYTAHCLPKSQRRGDAYADQRLTLIGNSWAVPVVSWFLQQLLSPLGLCQSFSPQQLLDKQGVRGTELLQNRLLRLPLRPLRGSASGESAEVLAGKLGNLVSIKGEDIMLTPGTVDQVKFHRLRASIPSRLWKWKVIAGWRWTGQPEHINNLEMRAILTSLKWRIIHQRHLKCRFIHLTDSLVCLHSLTRGRSSSRKLRRAISRINALLLASSSQGIWSYVHTDQNPADKPSRWGRKVKTKFKNA